MVIVMAGHHCSKHVPAGIDGRGAEGIPGANGGTCAYLCYSAAFLTNMVLKKSSLSRQHSSYFP